MKVLVIVACLACVVFASLEEDRQQWVNFKSQHAKKYQNAQEEKLRFSIFQQNLRSIEEHNKQYEEGKVTYFKGVNHFADMTKDEFRAMLKRSSAGRPKYNATSVYKKPAHLQAPSSIDWRDRGAVSAVKNQGNCGSCWAFSATGTLESFNYLNTGNMVTYSEQQLVDCDPNQGGCNGGDEGIALNYVQQYGIESESDYPYTASDGSCSYNQNLVALRIQSHVILTPKDEQQLLEAVGTLGPISVALDASNIDFYAGGIYSDPNCSEDDLDHAVLAVGYSSESGQDYWIIKNSWSTNWGEAGYFRIQRGNNMCGIATESVYPIL